jgi:hypothetical protein
MVFTAALLLQAEDLGKKIQPHTPGSETGFARVMIVLFIVMLALAGALGIWSFVRGCMGHKIKENR